VIKVANLLGTSILKKSFYHNGRLIKLLLRFPTGVNAVQLELSLDGNAVLDEDGDGIVAVGSAVIKRSSDLFVVNVYSFSFTYNLAPGFWIVVMLFSMSRGALSEFSWQY
jgi:hypothetical protein